jgi:endonuclease/exonuclease/phosphatase family metal-dependent hydrolase
VKLAQLQSLFESLTTLRANAHDDTLLPVVLCGDFNLAPHGALYEFISRGSLDVSGLSKHLLSGQTMDDRQKVTNSDPQARRFSIV